MKFLALTLSMFFKATIYRAMTVDAQCLDNDNVSRQVKNELQEENTVVTSNSDQRKFLLRSINDAIVLTDFFTRVAISTTSTRI